MKQKAVTKYFDAHSQFWSEYYKTNNSYSLIVKQRQAEALSLIDGLHLTRPRVLEIGCGAGFMAIALAQRDFTVKASDISEAMLKQARNNILEANVSVDLTLQDAHNLTFKDNSFDVVVALGVLHWLHDAKKAISEIRRVLKPGGYAVLSNNREHALLNPFSLPAVESLIDKVRPRKGVNKQRHSFTNNEFDGLLTHANFTIIKSADMGFGPFPIPESIAVKVQWKLQQYAAKGFPIICSARSQHIVLFNRKDSML